MSQTKSAAETPAAAAAAAADLAAMAPGGLDLAAPLADARLSLRLAAGRERPAFTDAAARADRAHAQLDAFREAHNLHRPAIYPDSRILQAGLPMLAAGFEALFSAALFAETEERGLLGGAVVALGLSGANVSLGFLCGFLGLRYLGHRAMTMRVLGAVAAVVMFALAFGLNLYAAHWRNTATAGAHVEVYADYSVFDMSPQAIILLMLGASVWVFAALKGYSGFDDPYPDYGKLDRAAAGAGDALADQRERLRVALEAPVTSARAALAGQLAAAEEALARMRKRYDDASAEIQRIEAEARRGGSEPRDPNPLAAAAEHILQTEARLAAWRGEAAAGLEALTTDMEREAAV
ncbi:MAG: hypothetical protein AB7M12_11245 [Hyphomonadaceae bacterium]